ncbi:MAG: hypothetical protein K2O29_00180 [Ruminococcus sp.]|nr:hypothetical protein [Ruminococcus sp.]
MKKIKILQALIFTVVLLLSIISFFVLPNSVAVQWNSEGASNHISKAIDISIPVIISLFGIVSWKYSSIRYNANIEASKKLQTIHSVIWGIVSCTGVIINIIFMIMN